MSTEPNIKYRVTGAMVLIALAVIFLPLILDGQKKNQILDSKIPEKPISGEIILVNVEPPKKDLLSETPTIKKTKIETVLDKPIEKVEVEDKKKPIVKQEITKVPVVKSEPVAKPPIKRQDRPNYKSSAFVIQLGSFSNKANAQKLVNKLKKSGYKAYLKVGKSNGKSINRVLVGPDLKRHQAESKIKSLNKISGLKAIIVSYDPLRH